MNITTLRIGCSNCNLREVCMPLGLTLKDMETVEELVSARRRIRRGEALYRAGDYFNNLYVVRLGFLKSTVMSSDGREQVTNFFMAGEMIGLDGISSNVYFDPEGLRAIVSAVDLDHSPSPMKIQKA